MNTAAHDWTAKSYDHTNRGTVALGQEVLDRLELRGDETVLDAGCGAGAITEAITQRVPNGCVVGIDASPAMVEVARERLGDRATILLDDLVTFDLGGEKFDVVFSTATFHWIKQHREAFTNIHRQMVPGGLFAVQCGGFGNTGQFRVACAAASNEPPFAEYLAGFDPWYTATVEDTEADLTAAGFSVSKCWLEPRPIHPPDPEAHLREIMTVAHQARLPEELHASFVARVHELVGDISVIPFVRLNFEAVA